ncbi:MULTISPECIES: hypothetical protein [Methanobrevibacter]|uniref:Uncharacterized protein n=1 Tax=Methanobrevibacter gottschalkii DSM 11977 TaxID=1122229 RepID=A0A3N5B8C8_9EURY|nr:MULTISPECIES: hypothetical protein [Methanobrevibacter]OEC98013.1 hypothetical protein A9505_04825 [Methanobrevibacter sp. A27]RPF51750.1 hypothetical protein EDC42_1085 [Methanobrevibacter gottschalkii DSM 11977]
MKNYVIILIGVIIALVIVGGAIAYTSMHDDTSDNNNTTIKSCIPNITNATNDAPNATGDDKNTTSSEPYVVSEVVKFNAQQGEGYYREVTYSDGNFRQYDVDTGKLIGSSYDSDQDKLPSME